MIDEIIAKVKEMTDSQIQAEIKTNTIENLSLEKSVSAMVYDFCNDRELCKLLDIDYARLPNEDYAKLTLVAWYIIKNNRRFENGKEKEGNNS